MNEDIVSITAEMDEQADIIRRAQEEWRTLRELRDEYLDRHLATLTDEQITGDEALLRELLREAWSHRGASHVVHRLYATGRQDVVAEGVDGRDEYAEACLPGLQLRLVEGQDVEELAEAIKTWAGKWALGRTDLHIRILEHTLSRWGSYHVTYRPGRVVAELTGPYEREIMTGPLRAVLEHAARECWYERPDGSMGEPDDDYPYYRN